jgi:hypothetical protein
MRILFFWLLTIAAAILGFRIVTILVYDTGRLTAYGFGFLSGLIILFLLALGIIVLLGYKSFKKPSPAKHNLKIQFKKDKV